MINLIKSFLNANWKVNLLLLLSTFLIYLFYFHHIFFNINSLLSSITGDSLKNYYTYAYHIKNDGGLLHFEGMNFPFGEHVVYTDCQPLLTFILRPLYFSHNYLIGIMHFLIFSSFIVTPLIIYKILQHLNIDSFSSFFISIAISLLSPQFAKINAGHHSLAYGYVVPISILLILNFIAKGSFVNGCLLFFYNALLFFLHPYFGISASVFCFISLFSYHLIDFSRLRILKQFAITFAVSIVPVVVFKLFMLFTDQHKNRTIEPYGSDALIENTASILAPDFGPFQTLMEAIFPNKALHFEGHSYLGFFTIILSLVLMVVSPFIYKKLKLKKELTALLISSFVLLLISFGLHNSLLTFFSLKFSSLTQFRATCRFAWVFYHVLPLFVVVVLYHSLKPLYESRRFLFFSRAVALIFFSLNFIEANSFLTKDSWAFWKFSNFFREEFLSAEERGNISKIKSINPQAIIPLPIAMVGSEIYDRIGGDNSMLPGIVYSYHCRIPLVSSWLSRTSISETEEVIQLLNPSKRNKLALKGLDTRDFLVIKTKDSLLPDESRIAHRSQMFFTNDTLSLGKIYVRELLSRKPEGKSITLHESIKTDTNNLVHIPWENKRPFLEANFDNYEYIYTLDSNRVAPGNYVVSFHFHYVEKTYKSLACNLLITKRRGEEFAWEYYLPMAVLSGFYPGFGVFEYKIKLEPWNEYQFVIKGGLNKTYHISNFMLRPEAINIICLSSRGDTILNNYPQ